MTRGAVFCASRVQRARRAAGTLVELWATKAEVTVAVVVAADGLLPVIEEELVPAVAEHRARGDVTADSRGGTQHDVGRL